MSLDSGSTTFDPNKVRKIHVAIIAARYNSEMIEGLMTQSVDHLKELGATDSHIHISRVPGSAELAYASLLRAKSHKFHVIIALGVIVAGDTNHHELISQTVSKGLQDVSLKYSVPIINGVITGENREQAEARTIGDIPRGKEFASAAVEMALWK